MKGDLKLGHISETNSEKCGIIFKGIRFTFILCKFPRIIN